MPFTWTIRCFFVSNACFQLKVERWIPWEPWERCGKLAALKVPENMFCVSTIFHVAPSFVYKKAPYVPYPLKRICKCPYQGVRKNSFSESFAYVLNEGLLIIIILVKSFKNGPSKNCRRQSLKNLKQYSLPGQIISHQSF